MRICYVLLSPTFGMHQYTADLANRMAQAGHDVHLVTTKHAPHDRYLRNVTIHTPSETTNTGLSLESLRLGHLRQVLSVIYGLRPDVVHFTGPYLWNVLLIRRIAARGFMVVHTLHDLDPHAGTGYGVLLKLWNWFVAHSAHHILVHGQVYEQRLLAWGLSPQQVTWTPLLHLFLAGDQLALSSELASLSSIEYQNWALFFGRLERYKGVEHLITACAMMDSTEAPSPRVVIAGPGDLSALWPDALPSHLEVRNRLIPDDEALDLFRRCGLVVLPYVDATQSALISAAYYFRKPVLVTRVGALPEYVEDGRTGCVVEPGHPPSLVRCLEEMLNDKAWLVRMGTAGRNWYDDHRKTEERALVGMYHRLAYKRTLDGLVTQLSARSI